MNQDMCLHCGHPQQADTLSCAACGFINQRSEEARQIECENHSGEHAVGRCLVCGKPVCGDCAVNASGKFFCDSVEHPRIFESWKVIYTCESEFESDFIQRNLTDREIPCQVFAVHNHVGVYWLEGGNEVRVLVPNNLATSAWDVLQSLGLLGDSDAHLP